MNIMFFLTPKSETVFEFTTATMRQVIEKLEHHGYTSIPIIDESGRYYGTVTEGDLLRVLKDRNIRFDETEEILLSEIPLKIHHEPASVNADIESIVKLARTQNFVPVVDDNNVFIGLVKRSDIIDYCYNSMIKKPIRVI